MATRVKPEAKTRVRAFGYTRLSHDDSDSTSPQRQEAAIRRKAESEGWDLVEVFADLESAYNGKRRPGFAAMTDRLAECQIVVVWRLDRLSRGTIVEAGQIAEDWSRAGVRIVTTDSGDVDWTTADGEFRYGLTMLLARQESKRMSERTRAGLRHVRELGHYTSRPPFGWRVENKVLVEDPKQQKVLTKAAERYVRGDTLQAIASDLGFSAAGPLSKMLRSERVQEALPDDLRARLVVALRDRHWERVPTSKQSLLGGLAKCGECGGSMTRSSTRAGRNGRWYSYACPTAGHVHIAGPWLDQYVTEEVIAAIDVGRLTAAIKRRQWAGAKPRKVSEIEARIDLLDDMLTKGQITAERFQRKNAALVEQLVKADNAEWLRGVDPIPLELARNLSERGPTPNAITKRKVVRAVLETVTA